MEETESALRRHLADDLGGCRDVDVSESAVSHALSDLADAGLATRRKEGNRRYYEATELAAALFATADRGVAGP